MKITKEQLNKIIKEELKNVAESVLGGEQYPTLDDEIKLEFKSDLEELLTTALNNDIPNTWLSEKLMEYGRSLKNHVHMYEGEDVRERMDTENITHTPESCRKCGGEWVWNAGGGNCWKQKHSAKDFRQGKCK